MDKQLVSQQTRLHPVVLKNYTLSTPFWHRCVVAPTLQPGFASSEYLYGARRLRYLSLSQKTLYHRQKYKMSHHSYFTFAVCFHTQEYFLITHDLSLKRDLNRFRGTSCFGARQRERQQCTPLGGWGHSFARWYREQNASLGDNTKGVYLRPLRV